MRVILAVLAGVLVLGGLVLAYYSFKEQVPGIISPPPTKTTQQLNQPVNSPGNQPKTAVIAEGLDTPWALAFLPDQSILVTERAGRVRLINSSGALQSNPVTTIPSVREAGEGGLMGIALDPDFSSNNYVYLYYTFAESGGETQNRVVRMTYQNNQLSGEQTVVDNIPGASNHNGGRIKFGPDKMLYIGTGDAGEPSQSQDPNSLAGKILRVNNGKAEIYTSGHRNVQGLAWNSEGNFYSTEHGPSGGSLGTGNDEINLIEQGKNYGWPVIQGDQTRGGMVTPLRNSGIGTAWAPAGTTFFNGSLYFGGLRGQALYQAVLKDNQVVELKEHFKNELGRIREVILGPDNMLYITTSNRDGRGSPGSSDDRIIRVNPNML